MRTLVETRHVLIVETRGRIMLTGLLILMVLHMYVLYTLIQGLEMKRYALMNAAYMLVGISLFLYLVLALAVLKVFHDRKTVTFQGLKNHIAIERGFPFGIKVKNEILFEKIEAIEISPPELKGFCRLRLRSGKRIGLLKFALSDDYSPMERLDMITGKKVDKV